MAAARKPEKVDIHFSWHIPILTSRLKSVFRKQQHNKASMLSMVAMFSDL